MRVKESRTAALSAQMEQPLLTAVTIEAMRTIAGLSGIATAGVTDMICDGRSITGLIDHAARQGLYSGLVLGAFEMAVLFVNNLDLPAAAHQWTSSPPVGLGLLALYAAAFVLIGARAELRTGTKWAGARAAAVAGFVVATLFVVTFYILFTVFYTTMIQQPGHQGATHASLNGTVIGAAVFVPVVVTSIAALLGEFGGSFIVARRESRTTGRIDMAARQRSAPR